eukprot:123346-Chlamydomonas_euryale.AAC.4
MVSSMPRYALIASSRRRCRSCEQVWAWGVKTRECGGEKSGRQLQPPCGGAGLESRCRYNGVSVRGWGS